jgi:hypothetical protein
MCDKAILLDRGGIVFEGPVVEALREYHQVTA